MAKKVVEKRATAKKTSAVKASIKKNVKTAKSGIFVRKIKNKYRTRQNFNRKECYSLKAYDLGS